MAFPDTCMTPAAPSPLPIPYPNIAQVSQAKGGTCSAKTKFSGKKVILKGSEISMSSGDEAGNSPGGVASGKFKGPAQFKLASNTVKVEGKGVVYIGCMVGHNGVPAHNMPAGAQIAPSQTKIKVMP